MFSYQSFHPTLMKPGQQKGEGPFFFTIFCAVAYLPLGKPLYGYLIPNDIFNRPCRTAGQMLKKICKQIGKELL